MPSTKTYIWQEAPFTRLLLSLSVGIIIQWNFPLQVYVLYSAAAFLSLTIISYFFLPDIKQFHLARLNGLSILLLIVSAGALLVYANDVRNDKKWAGHQLKENSYTVVTLIEDLIEKENSYEARATIESVIRNDSAYKVKGKIIIYFQKDSSFKILRYGSQVIFNTALQEIKNSGNPGTFDYKRYALFGGITHQVYLKAGDFQQLPTTKTTYLGTFLLSTKGAVIKTLKKFITGSKEQGLAEALLIGYKGDLDKTLVQSYSNTGVVHIIAISGLHLGLIYGLLVLLTRPLKRKKGASWLRFIIIIIGLWGFSLIAGAQPSVLRSSIMFSFLALSELINKRKSNYNLLACSAFLLLCYNPFWLWDVGFQLSYSAVLSIMIFYRPIYILGTTPNKAIDKLWQYTSATLAAQILTLPIILYHFHQFPLLFLIANLIAVPLSSLILYGELLLLLVYFITPVAKFVGMIVENLIKAMNLYIERLDGIQFAVWNGFSISIFQVVLLFGFIISTVYWLMERQRQAMWFCLFCLMGFVSIRTYSFIKANKQNKLIVYNVPKHQAIDIIKGRHYFFIGDSSLSEDSFLRNFHLQPSRIQHRISSLGVLQEKSFIFSNCWVLIIDTTISFVPTAHKPLLDVLILSKNPKLYIKDVNQAFLIKQIVMDGCVPDRKKKLWKKDCDSLHLPYYDVSEKGAFVMKMR